MDIRAWSTPSSPPWRARPVVEHAVRPNVMATNMPFVGRGWSHEDPDRCQRMGHGTVRPPAGQGHAPSITVTASVTRGRPVIAGATEAPDAARRWRRTASWCSSAFAAGRAGWAGDRGLLAGAGKGLVIVDCSTAEPDSTARASAARRWAWPSSTRRCRARRWKPRPGAERDGGRRCGRRLRASEPVLRAFAENVFHMGPPGRGHVIKLLNNFVAQAICTATPKPSRGRRAGGIDLRKLVELVSLGPVNCGLFQAMAKTLDGQMDGWFQLDNARRDVRYYTHLAEGLGIPSLMGEAVHQSLVLASALGHGRKYVPSLVEAQERSSAARTAGAALGTRLAAPGARGRTRSGGPGMKTLATATDLHRQPPGGRGGARPCRRRQGAGLGAAGRLRGLRCRPRLGARPRARTGRPGAVAVRATTTSPPWKGRRPDAPRAAAGDRWTRSQLDDEQVRFLARLPMLDETAEVLYVHANAWAPRNGATSSPLRRRCAAFLQHAQLVTFCGHVHRAAAVPVVHRQGRRLRATPGVPIPLWHSASGWCCPAAWGTAARRRPGRYATRCTTTPPALLTYWRVPYDHDTAAARSRAAGLPAALSAGHGV